ncbi:hypothetical protein HNP37_003939 [Flavobacterium nitrogenifigens]|uniref:Uncharacterized protein n=2 Tax=Flavobacterium TaxID=237 RepID=A0A7W7J0A0_9FLAO|nr:hypothetical protein [Flavobacterium nitrogenifigens]MBB6388989.1 hypothetical protein [Flavobacterium notoginsengisoli]
MVNLRLSKKNTAITDKFRKRHFFLVLIGFLSFAFLYLSHKNKKYC